MRAASVDYTVPADGCLSYQTLYQALAAFEADLHQHIHLENNILFPRAVEMENTLTVPR
jgi:regulator of cell morphogenesis and NO signaling